MSKYKILALFGESGTGKNTILDWLSEYKNINRIISFTTRPPRAHEIHGIDYYFVNKDDFKKIKMLEKSCFRDWFYGTPLESLSKDKINVGIFNIEGIRSILNSEKYEIDILPVYVQCPDKTRLLRCLSREDSVDCLEICRRFIADEKDFSTIDFDYVSYSNSFQREFYNILNIPKIKNFIEKEEI